MLRGSSQRPGGLVFACLCSPLSGIVFHPDIILLLLHRCGLASSVILGWHNIIILEPLLRTVCFDGGNLFPAVFLGQDGLRVVCEFPLDVACCVFYEVAKRVEHVYLSSGGGQGLTFGVPRPTWLQTEFLGDRSTALPVWLGLLPSSIVEGALSELKLLVVVMMIILVFNGVPQILILLFWKPSPAFKYFDYPIGLLVIVVLHLKLRIDLIIISYFIFMLNLVYILNLDLFLVLRKIKLLLMFLILIHFLNLILIILDVVAFTVKCVL